MSTLVTCMDSLSGTHDSVPVTPKADLARAHMWHLGSSVHWACPAASHNFPAIHICVGGAPKSPAAMGEVPVWACRREHSKAGHSSFRCSKEALSGESSSLVMHDLISCPPDIYSLAFLADSRGMHTAACTCKDDSVMSGGKGGCCNWCR